MNGVAKGFVYVIAWTTVTSLMLFGAVAIANFSAPFSNASTTGECGAPSSSASVDSNTKVSWAGKTWDLIGVNNGSDVRGIAGPSGTVTLLLDKDSIDSTKLIFGSSVNYSGSTLADKMASMFTALQPGDKAKVVTRTLQGGAVTDPDSISYNFEKISGSDVQANFWPLSLAEVAQLKASVRAYSRVNGDSYWTRTAQNGTYNAVYAVDDGIAANSSAYGILQIDTDNGISRQKYARPAVYVTASAVNSGNVSAKIEGTCSLTPSVNFGGYTYEVVGIRKADGTLQGSDLGQPNGSAALVLSKRSSGRFPYADQGTNIMGAFGNNANDYASSSLKTVYGRISSSLSDINVVLRNIPSSPNNSALSDQTLWPLSASEFEALDFQSRVFSPKDIWLRNKIDTTHINFAVLDATDSGTPQDVNSAGIRPALFYKLTSEVQTAWDARNAGWNVVKTLTPNFVEPQEPPEQPKLPLSIKPNSIPITPKTYDGNTTATMTSNVVAVSNLQGVEAYYDDLSATCQSALYSSSTVGTNIPVTVSGCTLSGSDANMYELSPTTTTVGNILAVPPPNPPTPSTPTNVLLSGSSISSGSSLVSPNGRYILAMQGDGNLVIYERPNNRVIWYSGTSRGAGTYTLANQGDGNIVIYRAGSGAIWDSRTSGFGNATLTLQNDGNLVAYTNTFNQPSWSIFTGRLLTYESLACTAAVCLNIGETLSANASKTAPNGKAKLIMQGDGNLVLYSNTGKALWNSRTSGNPGAKAVNQGDGNFVIYTANNRPLWNSGTSGRGKSILKLQTDGNLVLYNSSTATWNTRTSV